jgi:predicted nucleic acid-binding Zn ribbon protein
VTWKPLDDDTGPRRVKESLDPIARKLGAPRAAALEAVFARWTDVVGEIVAAHATPRSLRKGTLVVAVDDSAWATELRFLGPQIIERCAELAGPETVLKIEVRVAL